MLSHILDHHSTTFIFSPNTHHSLMDPKAAEVNQQRQAGQAPLVASLASKVGRVLQTLAQIGDQAPPTMSGGPNMGGFSPAMGAIGAVTPVSPFHSTVPPQIPVQAYYVYVSINAGLSDH